MPGYVMHLAEGSMIEKNLSEIFPLDEIWHARFETGLLLPDTKLKDDKKTSHFWSDSEIALLARKPDINAFLRKYRELLEDPLVLGYLAHLYLDACYEREYWPTVMSFYDKDGNPEVLKNKITQVKIHKTEKTVPVQEFFTPEYYYGEYSKLNGYFINKYNITVPKVELVENCPIEEVDVKDLKTIINGIGGLVLTSVPGRETEVQIFDIDKIEKFIISTAKEFTEKIRRLSFYDPSQDRY